MSANKVVRVGVIGCGEITQVVHLPNLHYMSDRFQVTFLCDISNNALSHCSKTIAGPPVKTTRFAEELCASPDVDLVLIANSDSFHVPHACLALKHNKHVFIEKPMAMSLQDADAVIAAEKAAGGNKVFVGYMRRHADAFRDIEREIKTPGLRGLRYARVSGIVGWSKPLVAQSGTFPRYFSDYTDEDKAELKKRTSAVQEQGLHKELGIPVNDRTAATWSLLGGLGSHDLSAMRELFGMPSAVLGASMVQTPASPFWSCLFQYPDFAVAYESGIDSVDRFDAYIEMFFDEKTVRLSYDSPYIKGLPVKIHVKEKTRDGAFTESTVRRTFEDPYTQQMRELYEFVADGKPTKTTAEDARKDVEIFGMFMKACKLDG
ncbi:NAD(P)-binding domain protein [Niveomyces insectorum RCEF 264]|uniref:NAD(P)-binding domain protein n=1 Tax=Niveomyces insectorum RCEF 264 TaxID=1081102 RepID=A0A167T6Y9_9HYPO|nr:NAD(P)-binding domain protein [Niveomyces insectorum RCEF 264]